MDTTIWQENDADRLMHQIHQTMRLFAKTLNQEIAKSGIYSSEWTILNLLHHRGECAQADLSPYLASSRQHLENAHEDGRKKRDCPGVLQGATG